MIIKLSTVAHAARLPGIHLSRCHPFRAPALKVCGSGLGTFFTTGSMLLWIGVPCWMAIRRFRKTDRNGAMRLSPGMPYFYIPPGQTQHKPMNPPFAIYTLLDLMGTFVFALSGAVAARHKGLDLFGIFTIAFTVACGGGIIRDLCIGAIPPAGLTNWLYLVMVVAATVMAIGFYGTVNRLNQPVLLFDALGLSVFAVAGARKAIMFDHNYEVAILLGIVTAVGGGVIRDILLARVPVILKKEIYASAAMLGAIIVVAGHYFRFSNEMVSVTAIVVCFGFRFLGLRYQWNLPSFPGKGGRPDQEEH